MATTWDEWRQNRLWTQQRCSGVRYNRRRKNICYHIGCSPLSRMVTNRWLQLFGHIARSSPREDHQWAVAVAIWQVPPDWKRPIGRSSHTWLHATEADLGPMNFGLPIAWRKTTTRDELWTQQCSSRVCYERKYTMLVHQLLLHILWQIPNAYTFNSCHSIQVLHTVPYCALTLIFTSSGPGRRCAVTGCSDPLVPPFIFCRFTFIMLQRKALLLATCSRLLCLNSASTSSARSAGNSLMASIARSSRSPSASSPDTTSNTLRLQDTAAIVNNTSTCSTVPVNWSLGVRDTWLLSHTTVTNGYFTQTT